MQSALLLAPFVCVSACVEVQSDPNFVGQDPQSQVVTIGAGRALVSGPTEADEAYWRLWYIIDPATRTCWFKIGDSVGRLECCRLWTVPKAKPFLVSRMRLSCPATEAPEGAD
jgi:hypothetical protein